MREVRMQGELQRIRKEMLVVYFTWSTQETQVTLTTVPSKVQALHALPTPQAGEVTCASVYKETGGPVSSRQSVI
jgi:hypothetical protein